MGGMDARPGNMAGRDTLFVRVLVCYCELHGQTSLSMPPPRKSFVVSDGRTVGQLVKLLQFQTVTHIT